MLEKVKHNIKRLIAAYEAEKMEKNRLQSALAQVLAQNEAYRKQITELERQIDNLKLSEAFKAGGEGSFKVALNTSKLPVGEALVIVTLTTNSPLRPIVNLFIAGWIE